MSQPEHMESLVHNMKWSGEYMMNVKLNDACLECKDYWNSSYSLEVPQGIV